MFFKSIDKFFDQIKSFISVIIFTLITLASYFFIYWLLTSVGVPLPEWLNIISWAVIDFFAMGGRGSKTYEELIPVLPVLTSGVFIILTYLANCLLVFFENNHKRFQSHVIDYRTNLEKTINRELHNSFIKELNKNDFMIVKIKIEAKKHTSYLTAMTDEKISSQEIEKHISNLILNSVKFDYILKKGISNDSVYFLLSDLQASKEFFLNLVSASVKLIGSHLSPKLKIDFFCATDVFENITMESERSEYLDKMLELKVANKILVTPKFKVYFDNIHPAFYFFKVEGEYNLTGKNSKSGYTMFYSLHKKN